jgi:hypothetical protein
MKRFLKLFNTKTLIVFLLVAIITTVFSIRFIGNVVIYSYYSYQISSIENDATQGILTANGYRNWTDAKIKAYDNAVEKKSSFIENSDIAMYLYHAGFSSLGKLFRAIAIIAIITLLCFSVLSLYLTEKILARRFTRYLKRTKSRYIATR